MGVSLPLNPIAVLEYFRNRGENDREKVANYVDSIAAEAKALAEIWESVIIDLANRDGRFALDDRADILRIADAYNDPNALYFYRLRWFYCDISQALADTADIETVGDVVMRLGSLLYQRDVTRRAYDHAIKKLKEAVFLSPDNLEVDLSDLSSLPSVLHREAAAIGVLAERIRASTK